MWYSAGIPLGIPIWRGILGIPAKNPGISWYTQPLIISSQAGPFLRARGYEGGGQGYEGRRAKRAVESRRVPRRAIFKNDALSNGATW